MGKVIRRAIVCSCLAISGHAHAWEQLNTTGIKITQLQPRNWGYTTSTAQWFSVILDHTVTSTCPISPTARVAIPKANPFTALGQPPENPAYRDYVNSVSLAFALNRDVILYYDGCVEGYPRIVGLDVL